MARLVKNQAAMWQTWGLKELDKTKRLSLSLSFSCIADGFLPAEPLRGLFNTHAVKN